MIFSLELIGKKFLIEKVNSELTLSNNLKTLLNTEEFSDVKFEIEGKIVNAHRNIFAARSTYFKNILLENIKSNKTLSKPIHLENISYNAFKSLMYYLYTDSIEDETKGEIVCELIRVSEWYNLEKLTDVGLLFIKEKLCLDNVLSILVCATKKQPLLDRVERACLKYLAKNFNSVLTNPEFKDLDKDILVKIAQFYGQFFKKPF
jgi:hypothetical protein